MIGLIWLILIALVSFGLGWVSWKVSPVILGIIALFTVLITIGSLFQIFGIGFLNEFIYQQSWIIAIAGGYLVGNIVSIFT